jgi:phospholipid-binding lipoprotein MlaA
MTFRRASGIAAPLVALVLLGGCATVGQDRLAEKDPLEKFNRGVWAVDMAADKVIMKPAAKAYRAVAPAPARRGITNAFANLTEPWSFVNNVLQGHGKRAMRNLGRFFVNSTIGIAGLWDRASKMGMPAAYEDLGQTMAVWGFNGGPYLVLPLFGPSTMRDAIGQGVGAYADPVSIGINHADVNVWYKRGFRALQVINARSELIESGGDAFLESSLDPYAAARSAYLQKRRADIMNQDDSGDAAGPADGAPAAEGVPTPVGDAAATPPAGKALPQSEASLPGEEPAASSAPATPTTPQPATQPAPESAAPLPGDAPTPSPHP